MKMLHWFTLAMMVAAVGCEQWGPSEADQKTNSASGFSQTGGRSQILAYREEIDRQNRKLKPAANRIGGPTYYPTSPFEEAFPPNNTPSYDQLFHSRNVGGVLFGRPPEPQAEGQSFSIPRFEYEMMPLVPGQARQVRLMFWTAPDIAKNTPTADFHCAAAIVTPATALAIDGRPVFTLTAIGLESGGAAINPALAGHRLGFRPAIADLFAEIDPRRFEGRGQRRYRLRGQTIGLMAAESMLHPDQRLLSAVVEAPFTVGIDAMIPRRGRGPEGTHLQFIYRSVSEGADLIGDESESVVIDVTNDVFASLTPTERAMAADLETILVLSRLVGCVRNGTITKFDEGENYLRLLGELEETYHENLDPKIDADLLADTAQTWFQEYDGTEKTLPKKMTLR